MGSSNLDDAISERVNCFLQGRNDVRLLDAGCGARNHFRFSHVAKVVGIDVSAKQLEQNDAVQEKILGDIQTYPLPKEEFDIVVCRDVLEHVPRPREALLNMFNTLKVGGLLILVFPNFFSFKGMATKFTPYRLHQLFYHYMNYTARGIHTYFRLSIIPSTVIRFAKDNGFSVVFKDFIEGGLTQRFKDRFRIIKWILEFLDGVIRVASGRKSNSLFLDSCALILIKGKIEGAGSDYRVIGVV